MLWIIFQAPMYNNNLKIKDLTELLIKKYKKHLKLKFFSLFV